jgi:outer membrane protein
MKSLLRPTLRLLPLSLAMAFAVAPVRAQSLLDLYQAAREHDAAYQSARAQYEAARHRAEQARAGLLPSATLSGSRSETQQDTRSSTSTGQREFGTGSASLSVTQPLYRPANQAAFEQGRRQAEAAQAQLTTASQDLIIRVSQAYFDVLSAQDTLAFVRAQKAAVSEQLASARRNFEVGTATITDTREAQARFDLVQAQEIAAENDLRVRRLALDSVTGRTDAKPLPLATPLALPAPEPSDVNAWVRQAEETSPSIRQARLGLEVARLETDRAKAGHLPTLDLNASRGYGRNLGGTALSPIDSRTLSTQVGVTLSVPLFAGFATQNRIRETLSLEEKAQADLENARRTVAQATRTAYFGLVSGTGQVRALEAAEASSQSALDANRLGYQVGVRINIDVLNAQSQLFQTKRDLAVARYNVLLGQLKLRQANGSLKPEDVGQINGLLARP